MARVFVQDTELQDIADAIREKNGTEDTYKPSEMGNAVRGIVTGDDNPLQYATFLNGNNIFRGAVFPEDYHLIFHIKGNTGSINIPLCFAYTNAKQITLCIDEIPIKGIATNNLFIGSRKMTEVNLDTTLVTNNFAGTFNDCTSLENINGELDLSNVTVQNKDSFGKCYALKEVRFVKETINLSISIAHPALLSNESIQSIIDGLADLTDGTAQTLTLHTDVKAKLTETQLATITSKNWTLA